MEKRMALVSCFQHSRRQHFHGGRVYTFWGGKTKKIMFTRATQRHIQHGGQRFLGFTDILSFPRLVLGKWCDTLFLSLFLGRRFGASFEGGILCFCCRRHFDFFIAIVYVYTFLTKSIC
jgi:hypothetical protein